MPTIKLWKILDWNATEVHVQDVSHLIPEFPTHDEPLLRPVHKARDPLHLAMLQKARAERKRLGLKLKNGRPKKIKDEK